MTQFQPPQPPYAPQPGQYATSNPYGPSRPGVITGLGVTAIIVAILGILSTSIMGISTLGVSRGITMYNQRQAASQRAKQQQQAASAQMVNAPRPAAVEYIADDGMPQAQRKIVILGLTSRRTLSDVRQKQLDALLAECGTLILPLSGDSLTVQGVAANVTKHGKLPGSSRGEGPTFYSLGNGDVNISDDGAIFYRSDGQPLCRLDHGRVSDDSGNIMLAAIEAAAVIERVQSLTPQALTAPQVHALGHALQLPDQTAIILNDSTQPFASQVKSALIDPKGSLIVTTASDVLTIDAAGNAQSSAPVMPGTNTAPMKVSKVAVTLATMEILGSLALATYLLVTGILVLRQTPRGRLMLWIYVAAKILIVIVGSLAWWWLFKGMSDSVDQSSGEYDALSFLKYMVMTLTLVGLIYPVAVAIALVSRSVREYYRPVGG